MGEETAEKYLEHAGVNEKKWHKIPKRNNNKKHLGNCHVSESQHICRVILDLDSAGVLLFHPNGPPSPRLGAVSTILRTRNGQALE